MKRPRRGLLLGLLLLGPGCSRSDPSGASAAPPTPSAAPFSPARVELRERAMGTEVALVAVTTRESDEAAVRDALGAAVAEMRRLERLLSDWTADSDVARVNQARGEPVAVGPDLLAVVDKALWVGARSDGAFDLTFQTLSDLWRFGDAMPEHPRPPRAEDVAAKRRLLGWDRVVLDRAAGTVAVKGGASMGVGGIAKGYIVDRAVQELRRRGLSSFLVQAGGDLYGAGRKPDGARWVSGIQDPRGARDRWFAAIELEDHAFSTAGDYARSFVFEGRRYHHILDPRTGWPATASRSVTVWAEDALTADAVDDAVFVLGPERGLELVESLPGVGCVIVDASNRVHVSARLRGKVRLEHPPTDAP